MQYRINNLDFCQFHFNFNFVKLRTVSYVCWVVETTDTDCEVQYRVREKYCQKVVENI